MSLRSRIHGAIIGHAVCDALGAPAEFQARGSFPLITEMQPNENFGLPAGCWTDDTSMMLCLAWSLVQRGGELDLLDAVERWVRWWRDGM